MTAPLLAGGLFLQFSDAAGNEEAQAKHAVLVTRVTACTSPGKTEVSAVAEGFIDGKRQTVPLRVMALRTPGTFAVAKEWPDKGTWAIKMTATNPEYKNYSFCALVPFKNNNVQPAEVKRYFREPTGAEIDAMLRSGEVAMATPSRRR